MLDTAKNSPKERELSIERLIDAPREIVFRCFREPDLLKRWFVPAPWTIANVDIDFRPGGRNLTVMRSPEGEEYPNEGVYLEIVPNEKIVVTDAYTAGWIPTDNPFMTATMEFIDEGGKTRYVAIARHWTDDACKRHKEMGFHEGWGKCAEQLDELARKIA